MMQTKYVLSRNGGVEFIAQSELSSAEILWMAGCSTNHIAAPALCTSSSQPSHGRAAECSPYLFETRKEGSLRTTGVVVSCPSSSSLNWATHNHAEYARAAISRRDAAACGKLAFFFDDELSVHQVGPDGGLTPAFCGNASAAVALAHGGSTAQLRLAAPGGGQVSTEYRRSGNTIRQDWLIPSAPVEGFTWRGRRVFRVQGLNLYNIVLGGLPVGITAETCRVQLAEGHPNAKLAVLDEGAGRCQVIFYNASGRHGAAPMTGLASLAVVASESRGFAAYLGERAVTYETASGQETFELPEIGTAEDGRMRIAMPDVDAFLSPLCEVS